MANDRQSLEEQIQLQKELIENNKEQVEQALELFETIRAIRRDYGQIDDELQRQLEGTEEILRQNEESLRVLENLEATLREIDAINEDIVDNNETILEDNKELYDIMTSIGSMLGKNNKLYETATVIYRGQQTTLSSIGDLMKSISDTDLKQKALDASNSYKNMGVTIADAGRELQKGNISQDEHNKLVLKSYDAFENVVHSIDESTQEGRDLKEMLMAAKNEMQSFAEAARKSQMHMQQMDQLFDSFSGIPAMSEINRLLKTNISDTLAWKAALFAVGAALGKMAFDYFGTPMKVGLEFDHQIAQNKLKLAQDLEKLNIEGQFIPAKIGLERDKNAVETANTVNRLTVEAGYAATKASNQFSVQMQEGAAQFRAAAKTARFGGQLGPTGYNIAELNLAGIDPGQISQQMSELATITGKVPTAELATDMALVAKRTGQSTESIASLAEFFQRTDDLSAETAVNMIEGMRAMAKASGLDLGNLMAGVAEASKDALSYQIMSAEALTKQVAAAQSIGVNFNKIAGAGKNMVLNYKDSIKAEMQLSSMLGRSVNLSEVRQKAMSGDYTGMMEAMRAQGLDPSQMNMFQQQQLSQALGGLDLDTIQKVYKGEITKPGDLTAGAAGAAGQEYLTKTKQAQASLATESATIQARAAIVDAQLSGKITDAYLASKGYTEYQDALNQLAADELKLNNIIQEAILKSTKYRDLESEIRKSEMLFNIFNTALQGLVMFLSGQLFSKLFGGGGITDIFKGLFGKITPGGPGPTPPMPPPIPPPNAPIRNAAGRWIDPITKRFVRAPIPPPTPPPVPPTPPGGSSILKNLFSPKTMSKGAKIGGSALAGIFGGFEGYTTKSEKNQAEIEQFREKTLARTDLTDLQKSAEIEKFESQKQSEALGAGAIQGGLAVGGTAVGAFFGGPVGAAIGGFVGNFLGEKLNEYVPGLSQIYGGVFDGMKKAFAWFKPIIDSIKTKLSSLFTALEPMIKPIKNAFNSIKGVFSNIAEALGFDGSGLGAILSQLASFVWNGLLTPFRALFSAFGFIIDIVTSVVKLFKGDFAGAWSTLKQGFLDFINGVISPFKKIIYTVYNAFADVWNYIADSALGKTFGLATMQKREIPKDEPVVTAKTETKAEVQPKSTKAKAQKNVDYTGLEMPMSSVASIAPTPEMMNAFASIQQQLDMIYKGQISMHADSITPILENIKVSKDANVQMPTMIVKATNAELNAQSNIIQLLEANVELLGMIVDNTDGDGKTGTTISLNGTKLGQMISSYNADRKGLLKNWNG